MEPFKLCLSIEICTFIKCCNPEVTFYDKTQSFQSLVRPAMAAPLSLAKMGATDVSCCIIIVVYEMIECL